MSAVNDDTTRVSGLVRSHGVGVLRQVLTLPEVAAIRQTILTNVDRMKNTRPARQSRHLAGFHRFAEFAWIHDAILEQSRINQVLEALSEGPIRAIGLTDITVDRSQPWHKDLLRGPFEHFLDDADIWGGRSGQVFKVLVYLQDSSSLKVIRGSHATEASLRSDHHVIPCDDDRVDTIHVQAGDVVIMDLRLTHRGSFEHEFQERKPGDASKILVSTVLGNAGNELTDRMEEGNASRQRHWDERWGVTVRDA